MDIAQYIADLLKEKDEVGVPSLGTFYTKNVNAFFDQNSNSFVPPGRELLFKSDESDPSVLINYISKIKNLSRPSSKYFAEKFGETLKTEINLVGKAEIPPLGSFEKISDGFIFNPSPKFKHINNFGLEAVTELLTKPLKSSPNTISDSILKTGSEGASGSTSQGPSVQEPASAFHSSGNTPIHTEEKPQIFEGPTQHINLKQQSPIPPYSADLNDDDQSQKRNGWLVALALFTVLVAVGVIAYFNYPGAFNFLQKPDATTVADTKIIPVNKEKPATDTPALSDSTLQDDSIKAGPQEQGPESENAPDTISNVTTDGGTIPQTEVITYEIIGASLQTKKEAENYIRAMKAKGINARIVENKPGRYIKVSIGSFTDPAKRDAALIQIKKDLNKNAWPLDVKIKR